MGENNPKLLDLIPNKREWLVNGREGEEYENKKLELKLGLPGDDYCSVGERKESQLLSLGYFSPTQKPHDQKQACLNNSNHTSPNPWPYQTQTQAQQQKSPYAHHPHHQYPNGPKRLPVVGKESSQPCCTRMADLQNAERKAFLPPSANTAVPNTSQKRAAPAPVVGWPPIRSFRKNLASASSAKPVSEPAENAVPSKAVNEKPANESSHKGLFVKINMDGVPIGRKVDLSAYDSYGKLSSAVDELFRGLLAAQRDSSVAVIENKQEEQKPITGLLDGSGEYTLVYEDNEGDRMLVGDVPWHMFVSTVKRLRVLKTSELPSLSRGGDKQSKLLQESGTKK